MTAMTMRQLPGEPGNVADFDYSNESSLLHEYLMLINISASGDNDGWQVKPRYKMQEVPEKGFLSESDTDEEPFFTRRQQL